MSVLTEAERRRRREATVAARRDVWRAAALSGGTELFARHGFHESSMNDIAAASGLSLRALYEVFASKDELYAAVVRAAFDTALPYLPEPADEEPGAHVLRVLEGFFEFVATNHEIALLYARGQQSAVRLADGRDPFAEYLQIVHERITALIEGAQRAGHAAGVDARVLALSVLTTVSAVVGQAIAEDPDAELSALSVDVLAVYAPHFA